MPDGGRVLLLRHGHTSRNKGSETSVDRIRGWDDIPLAAQGIQDAEKAAARLKDEPIHRVLTSDLKRSIQTGAVLARQHGLKPQPTRALRPWNLGVLQNRPSTEAQPVIVHYATAAPETAVPDGESFVDFKQRTLPALARLLAQVKKSGETVAIVTHYRDMKLITAWIAAGAKGTDLHMPTFWKDDVQPGGIIELTPNGSGWKCRVVSKGSD